MIGYMIQGEQGTLSRQIPEPMTVADALDIETQAREGGATIEKALIHGFETMKATFGTMVCFTAICGSMGDCGRAAKEAGVI